MKLRIYDPVVLALDLRHRRFGYAVLQGHRTLLEWGQRVYPAVGTVERELAGRRISKLLAGIKPDLILLKQERWVRGHNDPHLANPLVALQEEAERYLIPIRLIETDTVRATFAVYGCQTKQEIAATLSILFPELFFSLPPQRKPWQPEHPRMSIFDAAALAVAYWHRENNHIVIERRES